MSALTEAANNELDAQLLAQNNVIDGLSLVISRQRAVMLQALDHLMNLQPHLANGLLSSRQLQFIDPYIDEAIAALRNSLEGKQ